MLSYMRVDHLVWYCPDLEQGARHFADRMSCEPAYGGVHPGEGTRNCLVALGDNTYVEILGRDPAQLASCLGSELMTLAGAGLYHWAVGGVELERVREQGLSVGLEASSLVEGGRALPDGRWLGWKLLGFRNHGLGALVPFFIDWMESEHPARRAPRGGSLLGMKALSPEPERIRTIYRALGFDIPVEVGTTPAVIGVVSGQNGQHELWTFDPLPRGFVI